MTKQQLVDSLAQEASITKNMAGIIVDLMFQHMADNLAQGGRIEIRGFGTFQVREYGSRQGRNPKTGETVEVKPKKVPFFKAGRGLLERLNAE
jgi:integration host factor subunit beta